MPPLAVLVCLVVGGIALAAWLAILLEPARPWDLRPVAEDEPAPPEPAAWPPVAVIVPARNEVEALPLALPWLLAQDYPGDWRVVLVDDRSTDGTGELARRLADGAGAAARLTVVAGAELPAGWVGKVWAMEQGRRAVEADRRAYLLLTDSDIRHAPGSLRRLVAESEAGGLGLNSRMARLRCESRAERLLIPPFVFFFNLLYPMRRANDPASRVAACAGGCVLLRADALEAAGGFAAIRGEIIDDVNLARVVKRAGARTRLSVSRGDVASIREYGTLGPIWRMVRRSAFDELDYSWPKLAGTTVGMAVTFMLPSLAVPLALATVAARGAGALGGSWAWPLVGLAVALAPIALAALTYRTTARFFGLPARWLWTLPLAGTIYGLITLDSARVHVQGRSSW
ncbi:MAG: glycosyltransferase [Thermoleophilia bacterium]